LQNIELGIKS
ncbi:hypothetical protein D018_2202B, partial [Vibrio parahaemolyticus VP2007-007]